MQKSQCHVLSQVFICCYNGGNCWPTIRHQKGKFWVKMGDKKLYPIVVYFGEIHPKTDTKMQNLKSSGGYIHDQLSIAKHYGQNKN